MKRLSSASVLCFVLGIVLPSEVHSQWVQQRSGFRARLNDVVVLDSLTAIAVGQFGIILKTTNAGQTWMPKNISPIAQPQPQWNAIAFGTPAMGVVVGDNSRGAITTNGGDTWRNLFTVGTSFPPRNLLSVAFASPSSVFIGNDSGQVFISSNGGLTWRIQSFGGLPIIDIFFAGLSVTPQQGYVITPRLAYQTTDGGLTWRSQPLPVLGLGYARRGDITGNGAMAYAVGADGDFTTIPTILMRAQTDTSWRRWMYMPPIPVGVMNDLSAPTPQVAFACGKTLLSTSTVSQGMVFKTSNAGQFWGSQYGFRRRLNAIDFFNERRGFTVGDSGAIFFTASGGGPVIHAFQLLSPRDGDTLYVGASFRFQWERAPDLQLDTTWYQLFTSTTGPDGPWSYHSGTVDTITALLAVPTQGQHWWMVQAHDGMNAAASEFVFSFVTTTTVGVRSPETPSAFALYQNYPNPFNPVTTFNYQLPTVNHITLKVYDVLGREVATLVNEVKQPGTYTVKWDASGVTSGVYFYRLQSDLYTETRKLLLLK